MAHFATTTLVNARLFFTIGFNGITFRGANIYDGDCSLTQSLLFDENSVFKTHYKVMDSINSRSVSNSDGTNALVTRYVT